MRQIAFFMLSFVLSAPMIFAQEGAQITVDEKVHDFGKILEEADNASHEFIVKNTGNAPLVINRVSTSCGCTTPDWTRSPIAPGATGVIKATYSAKSRPGLFIKKIQVYTNVKDESVYELTIKGDVVPKGQSPDAAYPVKMGDLYLKNNSVLFSKQEGRGIPVSFFATTQDVDIYNEGNTPLTLSFADVPKHLTVSSSPAIIPAKKTGKIIITCDPEKIKKNKKTENKIRVVINGEKNKNHLINVSTITGE
jgi:hypothetical protein